MVSIRVSDHQLAEIDRRAQKAGLTRTSFMIMSALGGDPADKRLEIIERRLSRVEQRLGRE
jgi:uncharacterized protein (DUF1778 family)